MKRYTIITRGVFVAEHGELKPGDVTEFTTTDARVLLDRGMIQETNADVSIQSADERVILQRAYDELKEKYNTLVRKYNELKEDYDKATAPKAKAAKGSAKDEGE